MSYTSLTLSSKAFQLTTLSLALALAGCGGGDGDTVDVIAPEYDGSENSNSGGNSGGNGNGGGSNGGEQQNPEAESNFFIQTLSTTPSIIELTDEETTFNVTVKAVEVDSGGAVVGKAVSLSVLDSESKGITIEGQSVQTTDSDGNAVYTLKLNPQAVADRADLIDNGFTLIANANRADGTAVASQELNVSVRREGSGGGAQVIESDLDIQSMLATTSVSNNNLNPFGDTAQFTVTAKDTNGSRVEGVRVGLGIANVAGISIIGGNNKSTNANGIATFTINIDENLTVAQRNTLLNDVAYAINILEQNGATQEVTGVFTVAVPVSDYTLNVQGVEEVLNAYGDEQPLTIRATAKNNQVATNISGAKATIRLNTPVNGVTLSRESVTLDDNGLATVNLIIPSTLNASQRRTLATQGVSYTVTLSEPNRSVTVENYTNDVEIPEAVNTVSFEESNRRQISSSGGSAIISFRVNNNSTGGAVAGQTVIASLPSALAGSGLLTIDGSSEQTTDDRGVVNYTVRVPAGLTEAQKTALEQEAGSFALNVRAVEASGASTTASSQSITIGSAIGRSDIQLTSRSSLQTVNVTDEQFNIRVSAQRTNGSAATGNNVRLVLDNVLGVSIQGGNQQTTDQNGNAVFTINVNQDLTPAQRDALISSGITYTAILTDNDGTQARTTETIEVVRPASTIEFASIITPTISELGGNGSITVRLLTDATGQPVQNEQLSIQLGKKALDYGVSVNQTSATTDFNGETTFVVTIPQGLSAAQRQELKRTGINYQLSYVERGITYDSAIGQVDIDPATVDLDILNASTNNNSADYLLNSAGETQTIQVQMTNQSNGDQLANQPVRLRFDNPQLASLLTVNGQLGSSVVTSNTNANGIASFDIIVPNNLTDEQKQALDLQALTATLSQTVSNSTQQVRVRVQSMQPDLSLSASALQALNLNGGQAQIDVVAQDDEGNILTGQNVFLSLPASIASQGISLVSSGSQTTDNSGRATFTIAVPNDLTDEQKNSIGNSFMIALSAADSRGNIATQTVVVNTVSPTGTQETLTVGANKVVNTNGDTFKVFVRVTDNDGSIVGREVRLNVDNPIGTGVSIANGSATTNNDGVAAFDLTLEDGANVNQAILQAGIRLTASTITEENVRLEQNYIVAVDNTTIDSYEILASSDRATLRTGGDQTNAIFRVTDSSGGVLSGVPVQLSIDDLVTSGAALATPSVVTTDATGRIDVGVLLTANSVNARLNHNIVINARIVTPEYDIDGNVTTQVREEESLTLSAVGTSLELEATNPNLQDGGSTSITTTLIDGAGNPIANAGVELINADGDVISANAVTTTNENGQAVFEVAENNLTFDNNGNLRVFARAFGENRITTQRSLTSIDLVKVSQAGISFIDIQEVYDVNTPQTINVQIRRDTAQQASQLIGRQVEVQTTIGTFADGSAASGNVIVTKTITAANINGNIITVPVTLTSPLAGTAALQAMVVGEPRLSTTIDTRFRATTPAKMLFQTVKSVIAPGGSTEVVATVKDENDVPVEGQTVVFSRASDSSAGRLSAATAVTDSKGEARVVYQANASSPIEGVTINARLLQDNASIGVQTTNITVSEEAVYTTLAFANVLSSDDIYYTVRGSISVMDGSGRAVPNQEVSIKSYATNYAQGRVCLLDSTVTYKADENALSITSSEQEPVFIESSFISTEDLNFNYTLDQNEDLNQNNQLDPINPVAIIGGTVSDDGYSFVTNAEGRADFEIRYPLRYSNWVIVGFDATTFVNGSENTQTINYRLPVEVGAVSVVDSSLLTPWTNDASPFGTGGASCVDSLSVNINGGDPTDISDDKTTVSLTPEQNYTVSINGQTENGTQSNGFYTVDFDQVFDRGATLRITNNGLGFTKNLYID